MVLAIATGILILALCVIAWRLYTRTGSIESRIAPDHRAESLPHEWKRRRGEPARPSAPTAEHECPSCGEVFGDRQTLEAHQARFH